MPDPANPGRMMINAPRKPTNTAPQRCSPTFSPSTGPDKAVTTSGAVKLIAAAVAKEVDTKAVKYRTEDTNAHRPRTT
jgi:hypothetical protein